MTKPLSFTQAGLKRAIEGARKAGLRVIGIRPDGTLLTKHGDDGPEPLADLQLPAQNAQSSKWEDVQA